MIFGWARPPVGVRSLLEPGERVLAWAGAYGDRSRFVAATNRGLWWPDVPARRMPWHLINKAVWSDGVLTVTQASVTDDLLLVDRPAVTVRLEQAEPPDPAGGPERRSGGKPAPVEGEPAKLAKIVRQRVEASVAQTHLVRLDGGTARVVARKVGGQDGWAWWARLEPGTPDCDGVRTQLAMLIERLRADEAARREDL